MSQQKGASANLAIVGAACRFPGPVASLEEFRTLLDEGRDAVSFLPKDRFSADRFFSAAKNLPGHSYTNAAGILPDLLDFDPEFFGISRTEAMAMDPQQRLILEMTWEALENAGIRPSSLRGSSTGVYMGAAGTDTALRNTDDAAAASPYTMTGSTLSIVSNRVSYLFDFHGPSLSVDTACSSALVALHLACEALRGGEIPLAVVGAINCLFSPFPFGGFSKARMLSPDGRCKVFDASGNGYVRSEGGGVVLVTTEETARKKGWEILCLIAGTGVNSDGRTTGIALPNPEAQAALIRQVYERFGLDKTKLVYVEAHGTGTAAGDPLEASAIGRELGTPLRSLRPLPVGSVKSNIGHLETSAGMAGLLKALLVLRHDAIPPNLHFSTPNPAIDFQGCNIAVPTSRIPLPQAGGDELVSVNSFGFGGTNAHVVLQKPPRAKARKVPSTKEALPPVLLSARSSASLKRLAAACAERLDGADAALCRDFAHGMAKQRDHLEYRAVANGATPDQLASSLRAVAVDDKTGTTKAVREPAGKGKSGVFAFSGNGSQWSGMGNDLLDNALFRNSLEETDAVLAPLQGWSVMDVIRKPESFPEAFVQTEKSQPLIFAMQVGIVRVLESHGILPAAVVGHSVGEVAAAWCAGALSLADAARVIYVRSMLQAPLHGTGAMAAANMPVDVAREIIAPFADSVEIAAVNTGSSLSLAGKKDALKAVVDACKKRRIAAKMLDIPYPFHTRFMDAIDEKLGDSLADLSPMKPAIPFFSTVRGKMLPSFLPDAAYWRSNVRQSVLFAPALQAAFDKGYRLFLEVGASPVLRSYIRDTFRDRTESVFIAPTMTKNGKGQTDLDTAWKTAWQNGWQLDLKRVFPGRANPVTLPVYPWNRETCWRETTPECRGYLDQNRIHPLLGWQMPGQSPAFENTIHPADFPWLEDHVAGSQVVYPAAAFLESMLAAGEQVFPSRGTSLERVALFRPLSFPPDGAKALRLTVDREDGGLVLESRAYNSSEAWATYARARIVPGTGQARESVPYLESPERFGMAVDCESLYAMAERAHLHYGPTFRMVEEAWLKTDDQRPEALARLRDPGAAASAGMLLAPTLIDAAFHTLFLLLSSKASHNAQAYLPAAFERVDLIAAGTPRFAHARLEKISARSIVASFTLADGEGRPLLFIRGARFRRAAWLEYENAASKAYDLRLKRAPHPATVERPDVLTIRSVKRTLEKSLRSDGADACLPHWLLLQLASLAAIRQTVLTVCGQANQASGIACEELIAAVALSAGQEPWFRAMLERLENASLAVREENTWHIPPQDKRRDATVLWRTVVASAPEQSCENALLAHVFGRRKELLGGQLAGDENAVLPQALLQAYYANASSLKPYAEAVQRMIRSLLRKLEDGDELRVLQFSRDPESFVSPLIPSLAKGNCRYTVATPDGTAADAGNERFGQTPGVRFVPLSIEDAGPEHTGRYHLLIVQTCLHDCVSIGLALEQCRTMLAPGGILLLLEQPPSPFADYVLGSRPSWWRASPRQDTPVSLLQNSEFWVQELRQAAFEDIQCLEDENAPAFMVLASAPLHAASPAAAPGEEAAEEPETVSTRWLIVARKAGTASGRAALSLREALAASGEDSVLVLEGSDVGGSRFNPENSDHWRKIAESCPAGVPCRLIFMTGYDDRERLSSRDLDRVQSRGICALAALAKAWEHFGAQASLWVIAGGALGSGLPGESPLPSQGGLLGFSRVMANELRSSNLVFLDVHGQANAFPTEAVLRELREPDGEPEIVLADGARYVPRIVEHDEVEPSSPSGAAETTAQLWFDQPGRLRNLHWRAVEPLVPGPGEVCIRVSHTGLNFRDVMWSMGLLPDEALENGFSGAGLGIECSGVVEEVGPGVSEWSAGDEVLCFAPSCFSTHVVTPAATVARKPEALTFAEAATIPVAFITAWYSLKHLARLRPGQRVLIHGAAGGVGLAAIQIAMHLGLEVYATAGAAEKHNFLRRLGITRLYSSRSLDFADQIMAETGGQGLDCVLNSLSGEAASAGVGLLRPFGHFIELGKRDFYADSPMRLRPYSNNLTYYGVDVDQLFIHQPDLARELFGELMDLFAKRKLIPLPHTVYAAERVVDAFQAMQQSSHIGKLVVSVQEARYSAKPQPAPDKRFKAAPQGTYMVTGGSSGLGLAAAKFLARRGAKHILLLSRTGLKDHDAVTAVEALRARGTTVAEGLVDVADASALKDCLSECLDGLPPLRGVVHAAAALDDGMIPSLTPDRIRNALAAKSIGAWNLHEATLDAPLDFFALFSSATTLFGNPGQAGYVAANCMLESLAAWRRSKRLPAQVIGWGPIGDTGMLTRNPKARQLLLQRLGVSATRSDDAVSWLGQCLARDIGYSAYFGLNWQNRADLPILAAPRFSFLRPFRAASTGSEDSSLAAIRAASQEEGIRLVSAGLMDEVAHILRLPPDRISAHDSLAAQGMDSLMAVELALGVEQKFELTGYTLPLTEKTTIDGLARSIHALILGGEQSDGAQPDMIEQVTAKHGVKLAQSVHDETAKILSGDSHAV